MVRSDNAAYKIIFIVAHAGERHAPRRRAHGPIEPERDVVQLSALELVDCVGIPDAQGVVCDTTEEALPGGEVAARGGMRREDVAGDDGDDGDGGDDGDDCNDAMIAMMQ